VTVLDANILLYAYQTASPFHARAKAWLEGLLSSGEPIGLPWQTVGAFLRVVTNRRIPGQRVSPELAALAVDVWLDQPNVRMLAPGERHWPLLREMMTAGQANGPMVTDAALAALTIEYGGVLHTTDRDFTRFPGLRWKNPIE
jgi:toxin-antitoxin system PIN domain toxin